MKYAHSSYDFPDAGPEGDERSVVSHAISSGVSIGPDSVPAPSQVVVGQ